VPQDNSNLNIGLTD